MNALLEDFIKQRNKTVIKNYNDLKKEVAEDFKNTIKQFRKRHPYIKYIEFRSKDPWSSRGVIYMKDALDIFVKEDDVEIK